MAKYNLTTEDYENLAADTKAALLCYIEGDGDSDQYDTEEETETVKNLSEEEKKLYDEYREVYIKQLVEMGRVADLSAEIRRHMCKGRTGGGPNFLLFSDQFTHSRVGKCVASG